MNLTVDIGNTCTKLVAFDGQEPVDEMRMDDGEAYKLEAFCSKHDFTRGIFSSVVCLSREMEEALSALPFPMMRLQSGITPVPIDNKYKTPLTLGTDRLAAMQEAEPFKSGLKWGLRLGGRVIVPPIYRNIAAPVGNYCAFEGSPQQWGVIMLDGSVVVEARYSSVEISEGGTASLTVIPGKTKTVDLGAAFKQKTQNR